MYPVRSYIPDEWFESDGFGGKVRKPEYVGKEIPQINDHEKFAKLLTIVNDRFVFIITKAQYEKWNRFIEQYKLKEFIEYEMPDFVSNRRYPTSGRKLRLIILKGKGEKSYEDKV
jgi:hypothetical protein